MASYIDLTGRRFGCLTVIERAAKVKRPDRTFFTWRCLCDCGNETIVKGDNLRSGNTKSCGHLRVETARNLKRRRDKASP